MTNDKGGGIIIPGQYSQQHGLDSDQRKESCRSCLYTGVGTCLGLSVYFLYLAMEREEHRTMKQHHKREDAISRKNGHKSSSQESTKMNGKYSISHQASKPQSFQTTLMKFMQGSPTPKRNRPFLFAFSAVWAAAGAYRFYLN